MYIYFLEQSAIPLFFLEKEKNIIVNIYIFYMSLSYFYKNVYWGCKSADILHLQIYNNFI